MEDEGLYRVFTLELCIHTLVRILLIMSGWLAGNLGGTWYLGILWRSAGKWVIECVLLERDGWVH